LEKFYKTKEFHSIQVEWTEKLKAAGFKDIEYIHPDGNPGFMSSALGCESWPVDESRARVRFLYYNMAAKFLWDFNFEKPRHKLVWRYHSLGMSLRQIEKHIQGEHNAERVIKRLRPYFFQYIKEQLEWDDEQE
jgi:hypothetical protein